MISISISSWALEQIDCFVCKNYVKVAIYIREKFGVSIVIF